MKFNTVGFNNFKPFGEKIQRFSKKPITLVYGPNSMGKSSIIHMMLYMSYLQHTGDPDLISTDLFGDNINIGGFEKFIHKRDKNKSLKLELEYGDCSEEIIKFLELQEIEALSSVELSDLKSWLTGQTEVLENKLKDCFCYETENDEKVFRRARDIYEDGPCTTEETDFMVGNLSEPPCSGFYKDRYEGCLTTLSENYKAIEEYFYGKLGVTEEDFYGRLEGNRVNSESDSEYINGIAKNIISRIKEEWEYVKELKKDKPNLKINIEIKYSTKLKRVYIQKIEYLIDGKLYDVIECKVIEHKSDTFFFRSGASLDLSNCDFSYEERIEFGHPEILDRAPYYCKRRIFPGSNMTDIQPYTPPKYLNFDHTHRMAGDIIDLKQLSFNEGFIGLIGVFNDVMQSEETQYIGPLRFYPERESSLNKSVLSRGEKPDSRNSWYLLKENERLRHEVNAWLSDSKKFKTPYKVKYKKFYDINSLFLKLSTEEFNNIKQKTEDKITQIEKYNISADMSLDTIDTKDIIELGQSIAKNQGREVDEYSDYRDAQKYLEMLVEFSKLSEQEKFGDSFERTEISGELEYKEELVFEDMRNNTQISNRDLGLGVSQILPILIATNRQKNTTIVVEQPELHLHPVVQCDMADEFIRSMNVQNNRFFIETHSEHLLLRIMKRLRHSSEAKLKKGDELYLTPDDVCLLYVDNNGEFTYLNELELDDDGALLDPWPNGFFEEGLNEMFT